MRRNASLCDKSCALLSVVYMTCKSTRDIAKMTGLSVYKVNKSIRHLVTFDARQRISSKALGRESSRKGVVASEEIRRKISESRIAMYQNGYKSPSIGTKRTEESRAKMSAARRAYLERAPKKLRVNAKSEKAKARESARSRYKSLLRRCLNGKQKNSLSVSILGYTDRQLRSHIESMFTPEMSWSARESFHIDHIVPVAAFFDHGVDDPKIISALVNLRPITPAENRAKSDNYDRSNFLRDLDLIKASLARGLVL